MCLTFRNLGIMTGASARCATTGWQAGRLATLIEKPTACSAASATQRVRSIDEEKRCPMKIPRCPRGF